MSESNLNTKVFDGQVAGHGNILILPNETLIKRSCKTEIDFYKLVEDKNLPIRKFMPKCYNHDPSFDEIKKNLYQQMTTLYILIWKIYYYHLKIQQ